MEGRRRNLSKKKTQRVTLDFEERLYKRLRIEAAKRDTTLVNLVSQALEAYLTKK